MSSTSIKQRLREERLEQHPGVRAVSHEESARIAALNPGPGIPLSMLPPEMQQRLQEGKFVSVIELDCAVAKATANK